MPGLALRRPGTPLTLKRIGYGSMQLPGPHVWGPHASNHPIHEALARHLRENFKAADLKLSSEEIATLDQITGQASKAAE